MLSGDERSAILRLDVYANMYFFRLRDALREDFPALVRVLGDDRFHDLVTAYLIVHPSTSRSLGDAGAKLSSFLRHHEATRDVPYASDLARLEWALLEAFVAADARPCSATDLARVPADEWGGLRFGLVPSLRLTDTAHAIEDLWKAATAAEPAPIPAVPAERSLYLVWRKGLVVRLRAVDDIESVALASARAGETFADVCEALAARSGAAATAATILSRWLADELVASIDV